MKIGHLVPKIVYLGLYFGFWFAKRKKTYKIWYVVNTQPLNKKPLFA
jgi:hypothetical protein